MWQVVGWICALAAVPCKPVPDIAVIQSAYEREASAGSALHDKGLQVLQAKCHDTTSTEGFSAKSPSYRRAIRRSGCISTSSPSPAQVTTGNSRAGCASTDGASSGMAILGPRLNFRGATACGSRLCKAAQ
jgi:hypothetical protein